MFFIRCLALTAFFTLAICVIMYISLIVGAATMLVSMALIGTGSIGFFISQLLGLGVACGIAAQGAKLIINSESIFASARARFVRIKSQVYA